MGQTIVQDCGSQTSSPTTWEHHLFTVMHNIQSKLHHKETFVVNPGTTCLIQNLSPYYSHDSLYADSSLLFMVNKGNL